MFRPDWESFRPEYEVISPRLRVHTYTYVLYNKEYSHTFFACLFVLDLSLDQSEKNLELDLILFILRSSGKDLGKSTFIPWANRLSVRAHTLGE